MMLVSRGDAEQVFAQGLTRRWPLTGFEYFLYESYSFGLHARLTDLFCPTYVCICWATTRATVSVPLPGPNGTTILMARLGKDSMVCACEVLIKVKAKNAVRRSIVEKKFTFVSVRGGRQPQ
jgi:hypothetical protein